MKPPVHYVDALRLANAAGRDAGNRRMIAGNRIHWDWDDLRTAADTCRAVLEAHGFYIPDEESVT